MVKLVQQTADLLCDFGYNVYAGDSKYEGVYTNGNRVVLFSINLYGCMDFVGLVKYNTFTKETMEPFQIDSRMSPITKEAASVYLEINCDDDRWVPSPIVYATEEDLLYDETYSMHYKKYSKDQASQFFQLSNENQA